MFDCKCLSISDCTVSYVYVCNIEICWSVSVCFVLWEGLLGQAVGAVHQQVSDSVHRGGDDRQDAARGTGSVQPHRGLQSVHTCKLWSKRHDVQLMLN